MALEIVRTDTVDVLIVGAGGAGCRAAIEVAQQGRRCAVVCKEQLGRAHTGMAEGGLNVALSEYNPLSTPAQHFRDTLAGGGGINNQVLVDVFTRETRDRVSDLERYGVLFDRTEDAQMAQRYSGKQTHPLTAFIGDYTGREIMTALTDQVRRFGIEVYEEHFICELLVAGGRVAGALLLDLLHGELVHVRAGAVILATGGGGRIYQVTTNAASNTGDGYALALTIGCELVDMEMTQFHPTGMVHPASWRGVLVTESVRGEGGRLFNSQGERFMERYQPERLELAGRDEVARAIFEEVRAGRGSPNGGVYLSVVHLPATVIEERLPTMLEQFLSTGIDLRREAGEVHPSMHHVMGGVRIDLLGRTSAPGLYACGEVAGGIHGANRLGGNALAECQVFGRRAALGAGEFADAATVVDTDGPAVEAAERVRDLLRPKPHGIRPISIERQLQRVMWEQVGIVRDEDSLNFALIEIRRLRGEFQWVAPATDALIANAEWLACLELRNMLFVAEAITLSALTRRESRGAHFRGDYPERGPDWDCNVIVQSTDGVLTTRTAPLTTLPESV